VQRQSRPAVAGTVKVVSVGRSVAAGARAERSRQWVASGHGRRGRGRGVGPGRGRGARRSVESRALRNRAARCGVAGAAVVCVCEGCGEEFVRKSVKECERV